MSSLRMRLVRPVVARRLLRFELACAVRERGLTHQEMGARLRLSRASFSQMMAGQSLPHPAALEIVAKHLGIADDLPWLHELLALARSERPQTAAGGDRELAEALEVYTDSVEVYDAAVLSPLLDDASRSEVFTLPDPPAVTWVVEEHVLRRHADERSTALRCAKDLVAQQKLIVRVVLSAHGAHDGLHGGFQIVHGRGRSVVCESTRRATYYHCAPELVAEYRTLFAHLETLALGEEESAALLSDI